MKAKMTGEETVPESGVYLCQNCQIKFKFSAGKLACPKCGSTDSESLVMIYVENDPEQEQMYSEIDWHAGD